MLALCLLFSIDSKRFDEVHEDIHNIWHSQQYIFTREYFTRAPIFPPLGGLVNIWYLIRMFVYAIGRNLFDKSSYAYGRKFSKNYMILILLALFLLHINNFLLFLGIIAKERAQLKEWHEFERAATYNYAQTEAKKLRDTNKKSFLQQR